MHTNILNPYKPKNKTYKTGAFSFTPFWRNKQLKWKMRQERVGPTMIPNTHLKGHKRQGVEPRCNSSTFITLSEKTQSRNNTESHQDPGLDLQSISCTLSYTLFGQCRPDACKRGSEYGVVKREGRLCVCVCFSPRWGRICPRGGFCVLMVSQKRHWAQISPSESPPLPLLPQLPPPTLHRKQPSHDENIYQKCNTHTY